MNQKWVGADRMHGAKLTAEAPDDHGDVVFTIYPENRLAAAQAMGLPVEDVPDLIDWLAGHVDHATIPEGDTAATRLQRAAERLGYNVRHVTRRSVPEGNQFIITIDPHED